MDAVSTLHDKVDRIMGALARATNDLTLAHARIAKLEAALAASRAGAREHIAELEGALRHAHADHATDACAYADAHAHAHARAHDDATVQFEKDRLIAFKLADVEKKEQSLARAHDDATVQFEKDRLIAFKLADVEKKKQSPARAMSGGGAAAADNHCPVCTFVNTRDASTCTMCETKLR
jgi:hypothetical protein